MCQHITVGLSIFLGRRSAGKVVESVELQVKHDERLQSIDRHLQIEHLVALYHVLFLSVALGSLATQLTTFLLLGKFLILHHHQYKSVILCYCFAVL